MWSTCGCLAVIVGAVLCAVGVIAAAITNDPRDYLHSEYGGRVFVVGLALMAAGVLVTVGRLFHPRPR